MTTTTLKILALIMMLIDHIGSFIPSTPIWFRWIGRLSAPLFFFCMSWGFHYTKNRKKYLIRLYLFGVVMSILNLIIYNFLKIYYSRSIENNIFVTLFVSSFIIYIIDVYLNNRKKGKIYLVCFILLQLVGTTLILLLDMSRYHFPTKFLTALLGNIFTCEGGIIFVILGIMLYYTKHNKKLLAISYCVFCFLYSFIYHTNTIARVLMKTEQILPEPLHLILLIITSLLDINHIPIYHTRFYELTSYSWLVIFSLPLMLLYNGQKGKSFKYFFYLFYPIHIYVLYILGNIISK